MRPAIPPNDTSTNRPAPARMTHRVAGAWQCAEFNGRFTFVERSLPSHLRRSASAGSKVLAECPGTKHMENG